MAWTAETTRCFNVRTRNCIYQYQTPQKERLFIKIESIIKFGWTDKDKCAAEIAIHIYGISVLLFAMWPQNWTLSSQVEAFDSFCCRMARSAAIVPCCTFSHRRIAAITTHFIGKIILIVGVINLSTRFWVTYTQKDRLQVAWEEVSLFLLLLSDEGIISVDI